MRTFPSGQAQGLATTGGLHEEGLVVSTETLRTLDEQDLALVAGGGYYNGGSRYDGRGDCYNGGSRYDGRGGCGR